MKPGAFKRFCRRCAIGFGVLLAVIALFLIEEHVRGRIQLNAWMKEMRARGEKFTIAELTPPPTPPEQNGADVFRTVGFMPGRVIPKALPSSMHFVAPGKAVALALRPMWPIERDTVKFSTNGVTVLWKTNTSIQTPSVGGINLPMLITPEDLAADIAANSNALANLRAALQYPALDHWLDYSEGFVIRLPHLAPEKLASQWLRAASLSALYQANHEAALQNLVAIASLVHAKTNELMMISQLVRIALLQIGVAATWEALQAEGWNDKQLAQLQAAWQSDDCVSPMTRSFEMERAMGLRDFTRFLEDPWFQQLFDANIQLSWPTVPYDFESAMKPTADAFKSIVPAFKRFIYLPAWKVAWKDQDRLRLARYWQPIIEAGRQISDSLTNSSTVAAGVTDRSESSSFYDRCRYLLSPLLSGAGDKAILKALQAEAARELAVTAIAICRWELIESEPPKSLNELVPRILPSVPIDPMDGKPLRYLRNPDGTFLLYSVGTDGKDDGGTALSLTDGTRPSFTNGRDIVWPQRASPEEIAEFEKKR